MSPMKFRRTCSSCNSTFFAEDRRAGLCPKCARKKAATPARPQPVQEYSAPAPSVPKPRASMPSNTGSRPHQHSRPARPGGGGGRPARPIRPAKQPRQPKLSELSEELRAKIEAIYQQLKDSSEPLKKIHSQISHELWVKPKLVADAITQFRMRQKANEECTLEPAQRQQVITRYLEMVQSGERPEGGRRLAIAKELQFQPRDVVLAVREWSTGVMGQLSRQQLFEIEKLYWQAIHNKNGFKFDELPLMIAKQVGFASTEQVTRWLDQLHDRTKIEKVAPPTPEQADQIIDAYQDYLKQTEPPTQALHSTLAKIVGVLPSQVHRVLCDYRCKQKPE